MRAEKQFLLDEIKEKIEGSTGFVVTRYKEFTANKVRSFRDLVDKEQGEFEVVRKKVFLKALEKCGITFNADSLDGHIGVIFAKKDAAALAKMAVKYGDENDQALVILGGKVDEDIYSSQEMIELSALPGIQEMRAAFLGVVEAPMRDIVSICDAHLAGLLHCLEAKAKKDQ